MSDPDPNKVGKVVLTGLVVVAAVVVTALALVDHSFASRLSSDFWPPDKATVAPNILASVIQYALLALAALFVYPPWRRAVTGYIGRHVKSIHDKLDEHHAARTDQHDEVLRHLQHIIKHSRSIPDLPTKEDQ